MPSPVPKHLRTAEEITAVPRRLLEHRDDLNVNHQDGSHVIASKHPAKFAPGLPTALLKLAGTTNVGDPMAGVGRLAEESQCPVALNEPDPRWRSDLTRLQQNIGCEVSFQDAKTQLGWSRDVLIFSPPYYPRTDRKRPAAHNDEKRGPIVGFRTGYNSTVDGFVGDPAGVKGILIYRNAMREIYAALHKSGAQRMILVTKNWTRLGTELRLDLDTILTAQEAGWYPVERTGWTPKPSLWSRYNQQRKTGVSIEDILIFDAKSPSTA